MKTIETVVYDFDELPDEAKQRAIDKWYEQEEYFDLHTDISNFLDEIDPYFTDKEIAYSLTCSQGDGLSFAAKFNLRKWLDEKTDLKTSVKSALCELVTISSTGNRGRYCFANRHQIAIDFYDDCERPNVELLAAKIYAEIADYYVFICGKAEQYGYDILEYRMTESEFLDLCQINEYTFLPDGTMKNY